MTNKKLPEFDPDFSPDHEQNRDAAAARRLTFDHQKKSYCDEDGCLIRDEFGQLY